MRLVYRILGLLAVLIGIVGVFVPLLPTVPFMLLAAWLFARGNPEWERRLLAHPRFGPPIRAWRLHRAIAPRAKALALLMLAGSAVGGWLLLPGHWRYIPAAVAVTCGSWIATRASR